MKVLGQVLGLSHSVLLNDPCQLASQLLGRLKQIIAQDKPITSGTVFFFMYVFICNNALQQGFISKH